MNLILLQQVIELLEEKFPNSIPLKNNTPLEEFVRKQGQQDVVKFLNDHYEILEAKNGT